MDIPILTICDSAQDYNGKLCILGAFDSFAARELPVVHPGCNIAIRFITSPEDAGERDLRIRLVDADGTDILPKPMEAKIPFQMPPGATFFASNLVVGIHNLRFEKAGDYELEVAIDGTIQKSIPLRVLLLPEQQEE